METVGYTTVSFFPEGTSKRKQFNIARPNIRALYDFFNEMVIQGIVTSFQKSTSKVGPTYRQVFEAVIVGQSVRFEFSPSPRTGVDHEKDSSRRVVIAVGVVSTREELIRTIKDDIAGKYVGFTLENEVAKAFSEEYKPAWCQAFRPATDEEDANHHFDCVFTMRTKKERGTVKVNIKKEIKEELKKSGAKIKSFERHKQKAPDVPILELPYPCSRDLIHKRAFEVVQTHLRNLRDKKKKGNLK